MTSFGTVKLNAVFKMLDKCAPGWSRKQFKHKWWIRWNDRDFRLQLGKRNVKAPEVQIGNVDKMIRQLIIDPDCAEKHLPQIAPLSRDYWADAH